MNSEFKVLYNNVIKVNECIKTNKQIANNINLYCPELILHFQG